MSPDAHARRQVALRLVWMNAQPQPAHPIDVLLQDYWEAHHHWQALDVWLWRQRCRLLGWGWRTPTDTETDEWLALRDALDPAVRAVSVWEADATLELLEYVNSATTLYADPGHDYSFESLVGLVTTAHALQAERAALRRMVVTACVPPSSSAS